MAEQSDEYVQIPYKWYFDMSLQHLKNRCLFFDMTSLREMDAPSRFSTIYSKEVDLWRPFDLSMHETPSEKRWCLEFRPFKVDPHWQIGQKHFDRIAYLASMSIPVYKWPYEYNEQEGINEENLFCNRFL